VTTKQALRRTLTERRKQRSAEQRADDAARLAAVTATLPELLRADCVSLYASLPSEPGTGPLRTVLAGRGVRVLLPVVDSAPGRDAPRLDWALDDGDLTAGAILALPEPPGRRLGPDAVSQAQVLLIPALAVDGSGTRLGRGGGYYDAALTRAAPDALVLALVLDHEVLPAGSIPREAHDRPVHGAVTPARRLWLPTDRLTD
jgi:5-formyltetrahydrofolate cyclo-ligase